MIYDGPIYGRQSDVLCLHCIASGEATRSLAMPDGIAAGFTDVGEGVPKDVPRSVLEEVAQRTPGLPADGSRSTGATTAVTPPSTWVGWATTP